MELNLKLLGPGQTINVWRPNTIKHCLVTKHFTVWTPCLVLFDRIWSCLVNFEGHQTFDQKRKRFLLFACLMGDVLFVWTAAYETCLMRACVPRLLSCLYQLFHLCLLKHVLTVWPLTSTLACLVTKQYLMVFGRQTFIVVQALKDDQHRSTLAFSKPCIQTVQNWCIEDHVASRLCPAIFDRSL